MSLRLSLALGTTLLLCPPAGAAEILLVDDPLFDSTVGVQQGGAFVAGGGWQAAAGDVRIAYDLGQGWGEGRFEVDVQNFLPCVQPNNEKCHILSMWQSDNQTRDSSTAAGESHWIFRTGTGYFDPCEYKLLSRPIGIGELGYEARIDTGNSWDPAETYHYSISWNRDGRVVLSKRTGAGEVVLYDHTHDAPFRLRHLLLGRDREPKPNYGEQPGAIYRNLKIFVDDTSGGDPPDAGVEDGGEVDGGGGDGMVVVERLGPIDDTFAHPLEAALAHGDRTTFEVGGDGAGGQGRTPYLKFDLRGIHGTILSARLHAHVLNGGIGGRLVPVPSNAWEEETLTWDDRPFPGAALLDTLDGVAIDTWVSWDASAGLEGSDLRSFAVLSTADDGAAFASKEHPETDLRPYLEIVYETGGEPDAGVDAGGEDAGEADAGQDDAGAEDAGADPGADPGSADPGADTGADSGGGDPGSACVVDEDCPEGQICRTGACVTIEGEGCGCAAAGAGGAGALLWLLLAWAVRPGRRR